MQLRFLFSIYKPPFHRKYRLSRQINDLNNYFYQTVIVFCVSRLYRRCVAGVAFRGYRFAQPPVIESLRSPVLRTQHRRNAVEKSSGIVVGKFVCTPVFADAVSPVSLSEGIASLNPRLLNRCRSPVLRTLCSRNAMQI